MQFTPKKQSVIYGEHQNASKGQHCVIGAALRQHAHSSSRDGQKNKDCEQKTDTRIGNRRQIAQSNLDNEPGRAPNDTKRQPGYWHTPPNSRPPIVICPCAFRFHLRATIACRLRFVKPARARTWLSPREQTNVNAET